MLPAHACPVLDNGSDTIKAGYCIPEREPLLVTPSAARAAESERVVRCVERGEVVDWDVLESVYHHAFYEQLGWKAGEEGAVLVCEPQETPKACPPATCDAAGADPPRTARVARPVASCWRSCCSSSSTLRASTLRTLLSWRSTPPEG